MQRSTFAQNIIDRRKARGWSQRDLALEASIALNTIKAIERDISGGWPGTREAIAKALGCTIEDLSARPTLANLVGKEPEATITKSEVKSLLKDTVLETIQTVRDLENEKLRLKLEKSEKRVAELEAKLAHLKTLADLPMIEDLAPAWRNATDLLKYSVLLIMTGKEKYLNLVADKYAEAFPTVEAALRAFGGIRKL